MSGRNSLTMLGAAALFLGAVGGAASSQEPDPLLILGEASATFASIHTLCADFQQELNVVLLGEVTRSRGRLCQRRPDRFFMRFTEPMGDAVVADGEFLWIYYPSTDPKQVIRSPLGVEGGRFDFHAEFLSEPGRKYAPTWEGEEWLDGGRVDVLRLVPRAKSPYRSARVWIDRESKLIRMIEIEEENGSLRTVVLTDLEIDPVLDSELFSFVPPEGTQVITP